MKLAYLLRPCCTSSSSGALETHNSARSNLLGSVTYKVHARMRPKTKPKMAKMKLNTFVSSKASPGSRPMRNFFGIKTLETYYSPPLRMRP